ncbi:sulfite exporter TauE/SafE family protein [Alteromonas lipolytica]|uniref:Cytochrome biogenesis protein n=1 Tax=Alteromonas lipolytica TaxID=1856405 RepID=A0A1E8FH09_9ALTE|nr:sulfite exporter TauE/SafE family protein [Alteromonas lipolytica]OFI35225.1 cytochrome biogenesis protein [Alteromonas lipolytica]GGF57746.1 cytochrome biogenesis protein [Alteromonas lipolytica]
MNDFGFISAFLVGLAGSLHCVGMCGGIAGALRTAVPAGNQPLPYIVSYNLGRIISYAIAGAITGLLGQIARASVSHGLMVFQLISAAMLIAMGLYLAQWWRGLAKLESLGNGLWQRIRPLSKRFIPFKSPLWALPYGIIWGWLPCGLVYSTLTWALVSGSSWHGAAVMASFGLGTLPALIAVSIGAGWLIKVLQEPKAKSLVAILLIIYGVFLIYRTLNGNN